MPPLCQGRSCSYGPRSRGCLVVWTAQKPKFGFERGALAPGPVGLERGRDDRPICNATERPTDEEAVKAGFKDAQEWYAHSTAGALITPEVQRRNFQELQELPLPTASDEEQDSELVQQ